MLHLAVNIDHRYVRHCAVTLASAFKNNADEVFTVHIVGRGITDADRRALDQVAAPYHATLRYYVPDAHLLDGFTIRATHNRITEATYYRCFLSELLPADVDRVLYLDCDLLVLQPLRPFYDIDMGDCLAAGVIDVGCEEPSRYERLGYPAADSYFNAGVLLINLAAWRREDMAKACADYYRTNYERIVFNDQDILNGLLHDRKLTVGLQWNVQDGFFRRRTTLPAEWQVQRAEALRHPAILHFTNRKPWTYDSQHPLRRLYFEYLDLTPWHGRRPWHNPLNALRRFVRLLPFRLGLRPPRYLQV